MAAQLRFFEVLPAIINKGICMKSLLYETFAQYNRDIFTELFALYAQSH